MKIVNKFVICWAIEEGFIMKRILSLVLAITMVLSLLPSIAFAASSGVCGDNLTWTLTDAGVFTLSGTGDMAYYSYSKKPWGGLESKIKSIVIKSGVTSIAMSAFDYCTEVTSITLPSTLTAIGDYAFQGCSSLTAITIPKSVKTIGSMAFKDSDALTTITLNEGLQTIGRNAFVGASITEISIPSTVTRIGSAAFAYCYDIAKVKTPSISAWMGITFDNETANPLNKGADLYIGGTLAKSITVPSGIKAVGDYQFSGCRNITSVKLHSAVKTIGECAFSDCAALSSVTIASGTEEIGYGAFSNCDSIASITIPKSVKTIGSYAFSGCDGLSGALSITDGIENIGSAAFEGCTSITSVSIPKSVLQIGKNAFSRCSKLASITVDSQNSAYCSDSGVLLDKDKSILLQCPTAKSASSYAIPEGVSEIGEMAFYDCRELSSIIVPRSVTSIGNYAFGGYFNAMIYVCKDSFMHYYSGEHLLDFALLTDNAKKGDVNRDGAVDINDAELLYQHSMLPAQYAIDYAGAIDYTGDRKVDIKDALQLFQYSMLPEIYPIEE